MPERIRVADAAALLAVSDDTLRRWAEAGRITIHRDGGRATVEGADLAALATEVAGVYPRIMQTGAMGHADGVSSARNHLPGIVTRVVRDAVMAQVELQAGPFRMVSLLSREAADELDLQPGSLATATIKATNVVIERSGPPKGESAQQKESR